MCNCFNILEIGKNFNPYFLKTDGYGQKRTINLPVIIPLIKYPAFFEKRRGARGEEKNFFSREKAGYFILSTAFERYQKDLGGVSQTDGEAAPHTCSVTHHKQHIADFVIAPGKTTVTAGYKIIKAPDHAAVGVS